jgi:uncharacterized protein with von Willebrand factor type A (vWA) domain
LEIDLKLNISRNAEILTTQLGAALKRIEPTLEELKESVEKQDNIINEILDKIETLESASLENANIYRPDSSVSAAGGGV